MASKINIGATIGLDGEKEYRQALKNITSEQKLLTSEMKLASSQYSDNTNSLEALQSKNVILTKQIDTQTDKVKLYTKAVEDSVVKQKTAADNVEKYTSELSKAQVTMDEMKKSSNTSTESLDKQQKLIDDLTKKLTLSENAYDKNTQKINQYQISLNTSEAGLNKLNDELLQNEKYMTEASNSTDKCATSIDNMGKQTKQAETNTSTFGDSIKSNMTSAAIIGGVVALGYAFENVASKVVEIGVNAAKYADDMLTMSTQTGISTDKLQAYNYMAELTDTSMETLEKTMVKNIKSMTNAKNGSETYVNAYKELNVAFEDGNKNLLDSETVYWNLIDALGKIDDETKRDSLSMTIFGKSAQDLNTLIAQGSKGVSEFTDEAKKMGAILDSDTLQKLGATDDAMQRFTQSTEILKRKIGAELSDELTRSMDKISSAVSDSSDEITDLAENGIELLTDGLTWIIDNSDILIAGLSGIGAAMITSKMVSGVMAGVEAYKSLSTVLKTATITQEALNVAQASNPIGLLITAVAGLSAAFITYNALSTEATTETDRFIESTRNANTSLSESITKRSENISSVQSEIGFMKTLSTELTVLNEKEKLTNSEKSRMNEIVSKLNSTLPDLNLQIDEQTGKLEGNTKAIQDSIDKNLEWYKVQAAKEELNALYEEEAKAGLEVYKINQKIAEQNKIVSDSTERKIDLAEKHNEMLKNSTSLYDNFLGNISIENDKIRESNEVTAELELQKKKLQDATTTQLEQEEILNGFIGENTNLVKENAEEVERITGVTTVYGQVVENAGTAITDTIGELNEEFYKVKDSAEQSLNSQVGLFQAAEQQSTISVEKMASNLQTQTDAFNKYKDDLLLASDLVSKGLMDEGLLGYIESFGIQGSASLHELVTAAETDKESFTNLMNEWTEMSSAKDNLSNSMAEIETGYSDSMKNLGIIVEDGNKNIQKSTEDLGEQVGQYSNSVRDYFVSSYDGMVKDAESSVKVNSVSVQNTVTALMTDTITSMNTALTVVDGKSLKAESVGTTVIDGFVQGITNGAGKVTTAFQKVVNDSIKNADFSGLKSSIDKMLGDALD